MEKFLLHINITTEWHFEVLVNEKLYIIYTIIFKMEWKSMLVKMFANNS